MCGLVNIRSEHWANLFDSAGGVDDGGVWIGICWKGCCREWFVRWLMRRWGKHQVNLFNNPLDLINMHKPLIFFQHPFLVYSQNIIFTWILTFLNCINQIKQLKSNNFLHEWKRFYVLKFLIDFAVRNVPEIISIRMNVIADNGIKLKGWV